MCAVVVPYVCMRHVAQFAACPLLVNATFRGRLSFRISTSSLAESLGNARAERMNERLIACVNFSPSNLWLRLRRRMEFPAQFRVLPLCIKFALPVSPSVRTRSAAVAVADIAN